MKNITIKYKPIRWLPVTKTFAGAIPENWEKVTEKQFVMLTALSENDPLSRVVSLFTGIPARVCRKMDLYQLTCILWLSDWIQGAGSYDRFFIPSISTGKFLLTSPCEGLRKVTFGQFIFFDTAFVHYMESKSPGDLDRFIASLYIPAGSVFTDELPLTTEPLVKNIPENVKQAVLFNYTLVRRWLAGRYPLLFSLPDENTENPSPGKSNPTAWIKVFDSLVGDDISRHEEYAGIPLHNVLRYLTAKTKENAKR